MHDQWMRLGTTALALAWIGGTSACVPADEEGGEEAPSAASGVAPAPTADPDTTGAAVWAHIQAEDYRESWDLWPGLEPFYGGNDPHGMLLTTYTNPVAATALTAGETSMPDGAIVIKENYTPDRALAAITVMYKRAGYDAEHSDWFFAKFLPDGSLDTGPNGMALEGRVPGCQGCHIAQASQDYLYSPRPGGM